MFDKFDLDKFKEEYESSDYGALIYLENTIIADFKEKNKDSMYFTRYDYIISLFYATKNLNNCNAIYESSSVKNNFNYNLYFDTKYLLFEELGLNKLLEQ